MSETAFSSLEEWRPVIGYEGLYEVSSLGRVLAKAKEPWQILGKDRIRKTAVDHEGYAWLQLSKNGVRTFFKLSRLVALHFLPPPENPLRNEVNHIDGIKAHDYVANLEWTTRQENSRHAVKNGLTPRGERNIKAKLTEAQVRLIRQMRFARGDCTRIAKRYNVSKGAISTIRLRKTWKHIV